VEPRSPASEVLQQYQAAPSPGLTVSYAGLIGTDLTASSMASIARPTHGSLTVADPSQLARLKLRVQYDDGFAAYINGSLVAFRNASPAVMNGPLDYNATATTYHPDGAALQFEDIDLSTHLGALTPGGISWPSRLEYLPDKLRLPPPPGIERDHRRSS